MLYNEDCINGMNRIPEKSIDMILSDLPYGITKNRWDTPISLPDLWCQYDRIIKDNGAIVLFGGGMFTALLMTSNPRIWRYNLVWHKTTPTGFLNAKRMPLRAHEDICVFYKKLPVYNPQMRNGKRKVSTAAHKRNCKQSNNYNSVKPVDYDSAKRYPVSVLTFATDKQKEALHSTQKPVALCEYLILTYTNSEATVLDSCMGSGTTGIACGNTNRCFVGFEKDSDIFSVAAKRIGYAFRNTP